MSKHTPGPWVVDPANPNLVARDGDVYEYICEVSPSVFSNSTHSYDQECANARLIAVAPELLEALKELMEYAGIIEERCDTVATNKARAAIAKAEGKV